ncbi:hypothetical protein EYC80_006468 [Monilinia laxa]|uniref:Rhodopsin domain-containing protein n=1 Tax=Monilinia laxa TaxID=61186 RepID=A0A5N6JS18_MONLA|nr:hypothetical protein EYC80_006468 [Monilinia laxa]
MIWRTQMSMGTKLKVSGVFLVGIFLVVISVLRTIMQESKSSDPNDKFFWGELECLGMAFFANAPIINALYRRCKSGPVSNHLASRSQRSARNTHDIQLCSGDDSREMDFMEALRVSGPRFKEQGQETRKPPPAKISPSSPNFSDPKRKTIPNTNMLLSVSRSRGTNRHSLRCVQTVEIVQTSEAADPKNPMLTNALGGIGRVETKITHHDGPPLPTNPDVMDELYSSAHRSMTFEDMLAHGPPHKS